MAPWVDIGVEAKRVKVSLDDAAKRRQADRALVELAQYRVGYAFVVRYVVVPYFPGRSRKPGAGLNAEEGLGSQIRYAASRFDFLLYEARRLRFAQKKPNQRRNARVEIREKVDPLEGAQQEGRLYILQAKWNNDASAGPLELPAQRRSPFLLHPYGLERGGRDQRQQGSRPC